MRIPVTIKDISWSNFSWTHDVYYPGRVWSSQDTVLCDGEIVLSDVSDIPLSSQEYRNCFGIAGLSPTNKKVLAHICPGTLWNMSFSTVFLRKTRDEIQAILETWVDQGAFTHNEQMGIFGSRVFPKNTKNYWESLEILHALLAKVLPGDPQILSGPSFDKGFQHASLANNGLTIYKFSQKVTFPQETHFSLKQIRTRVNLLTS